MPCFTAWMPLTPDDDAPLVRVTVEVAYHRRYRGRRDRYGVPEEPDEPGSVEIARVSDGQGREIDPAPIEAFLERELARRRASEPPVKFF